VLVLLLGWVPTFLMWWVLASRGIRF